MQRIEQTDAGANDEAQGEPRTQMPNASVTARKRDPPFRAIQEHLEKVKGDRMNAEGIARRTKLNQCSLGEISPGVDAGTVEEALKVAVVEMAPRS